MIRSRLIHDNGDGTMDLKKTAANVAACPVTSAHVRETILSVARNMMLEEVGRRRLSSPVEKK